MTPCHPKGNFVDILGVSVICYPDIQTLVTYIRPYFDYYICQRSWTDVMHSPLFVCPSVCLSVSRITRKVMDGFEQHIMGR